MWDKGKVNKELQRLNKLTLVYMINNVTIKIKLT